MATAAAKRTVSKAAATTITLPVLGKGEHNAGLIFKDGQPSHWLILLPGSIEDATWQDAGKWAKKAGGELPTRSEQSLLYANLKDKFQTRWYWSGEQHAGSSGSAWGQSFSYGSQLTWHKGSSYHAVAVRRVPIQ